MTIRSVMFITAVAAVACALVPLSIGFPILGLSCIPLICVCFASERHRMRRSRLLAIALILIYAASIGPAIALVSAFYA